MQAARLHHFLNAQLLARIYLSLLVTLLGSSLISCTEKTATPLRAHSSAEQFVIANARVINATFLTGINTPRHTVIVGSDGAIIYSSDSTHWQTANTPSMYDNLTSISADTSGTQLIVTGENGLLAHSSNAGKDWQKITLPITQHLYLSAYDPAHNNWVAAGAEGIIFYAEASEQNALEKNASEKNNPAKKWLPARTPANAKPATLTALHYSEPLQALLASGDQGSLLASTDGGKNWAVIASDTSASLNAQLHLADATIILANDGSILRSEQNLNHWQKIELNKDTLLTQAAFDSAHNTLSIIADNGAIYISDDQGKHWGLSYSAPQRLRTLRYLEQHRQLVAGGANGTLLYSDNGGRVWLPSNGAIKGDIESLVSLSNGDILALGNGGLIARSRDGGKNWAPAQAAISEFIHQLSAAPKHKNLIAVGASGLVLMSDHTASHWQKPASPLQPQDYLFSFIADPATQRLIAAGSPGTIISSSDNGQSWQTQLTLGDPNAGYFHKLVSNNQGTLVALAGPGTSYYSSNNGASWQAANINNTEHLFKGVYATAHKRFVAVGNAGVIQVSATGKDWKIIDTGNTNNLQGIYAVGNLLFATGSNGTLLRSEDGGEHWQLLASNTTIAIQHVFAINNNNAILIACGLNGLILRSTDSGNTWQTIANPDSDNLREPVQDNATGIIYIPSRSGNILFSRDTGASWETMPRVTQQSIKGLYIDSEEKILIGYGERIIRLPLMSK